ncbi:MAG: transcription antitermination factor NusB [Planctomycetia bacterium]|nr:transcription antitermination factor NusB [Planctomycetia bacterium]
MRRRTQSRRLALQWLYKADLTSDWDDSDLETYLGLRGDPDEVRDRAREIVKGVIERRAALDALISRIAENWDISRMATIDRNVLRLAAWELVFTDTPGPVILNEAVELAKSFSTVNSGAFVNGILDRIRPDREKIRAGIEKA